MWGCNDDGQLGDGTTEDKETPVKIMKNVKSVSLSIGWFQSSAIKTDGILWTWGNNWYGQLGDGTTKEKHKPTKITIAKKMTISKVTSTKKKEIYVSWKKDTSFTGYQIYISTQKDFKKQTNKKNLKKTEGEWTIKGLKSGKTYYIKIRAYNKVGNKKYYEEWSKIKKITVK
jgi:hypothetical protein